MAESDLSLHPTSPPVNRAEDHSMDATTPSAMDSDNSIILTVNHRGSPHVYVFPLSATMEDLSSTIASELHIPTENQKFLIAPKPGMLKAPFPDTALIELLPDSIRSSPKFKITLLGTPAQEITDLNKAVSTNRRRLEARSTPSSHPRITRRPPSGVHTISSPSSDTYTFHRLLPLSYLPNPNRSLQFLARLRDDPGIKFAMQKHRFSVPLLTEMNPAEHTTESSRTLGLNRNKGEVIELRLRTDAYDGYRDYRTIRKTLCHELAHCVFSEHDRDFWNLTKQIEGEVERGDWTRGGHRLTEQEFYNPQDWEEQAGREEVDERGWTGGEFVLGGLREDDVGGRSSGAGAGATGVESRREILARAAEERLKKDKARERNPESNQ